MRPAPDAPIRLSVVPRADTDPALIPRLTEGTVIRQWPPEPWSDEVRRLALTVKAMRRTPKAQRDAEWSDAWKGANRQLIDALEAVE